MKKVLRALCLVLLFEACSPQEPAPDYRPSTAAGRETVYVAGASLNGNSSIATLWKNNVPVYLTTANQGYSSAGKVFVLGSDVYVAGTEAVAASFQVARIWKNGVGTTLSDPNIKGGASDVFVSGNDVYVSGYEIIGGYYKARLWKNGLSIPLPIGTQHSIAYCVYVSGNDVYVGGYTTTSSPLGNASLPTIWKNNIPIYYTNIINGNTINSIAVSGSDLYAAGSANGSGYIWKNGIATSIPNSGELFSVFVNGNDVYTAGDYINNSQGYSGVWKNGVANQLPNNNPGLAYSVYVRGTDVYVAGSDGWIANNPIPKYWKNGVGTTLNTSYTYGVAESIFVTP
jgi:hypothetical protein